MSKENPTTVDVYAVLADIREFTKLQNQVLADMRELAKTLGATMEHILSLTEERMRRAGTTAPNGKPAASDADLDGPHGDPEVKAKDPRDWSGEPMKGRKFSECPPEYLDMIADRLDYFTSQLGDSDEDKKKRGYNVKDAARARGWASRLRAGWKAPAPAPLTDTNNPFGGSDEPVSF